MCARTTRAGKPLILDRAALDALAASRPPREAFGPDGVHRWLAVASDAIRPDTAAWLANLPCPVIGVGGDAAACDAIVADARGLDPLTRTIAAAPIAAMVLVQHLRASATLPPAQALVAESFAYATVQHGPEFRAWRESARRLPPLAPDPDPLRIDVGPAAVRITLSRAAERNAIGTAMRDALCEAFDLAVALDLPIVLDAEGRCFSSGGAVQEFGMASDPATAHWVRSLRLPAARLLPVAARATAIVQGATIGAGVELAALCGRVVARPDAWFQLPELRYGLIPGAGGTMSLPRRIGRQRTAWMALSMARVAAPQAQAWGLVDAVAA